MSLGNPTKELRPVNPPPIPKPFDPRHISAAPAEPTLPRLTRLGPPTLPSLDTDLPPLPLPQPGFKKADHAISPSIYSNASSSGSSRRRSSQESNDARSISSRSSASTHDGYAPPKQGPWGYSPLAESQRKFSNTSDESSPKQSPQNKARTSLLSKFVPPRRPVGAGAPAQRGPPPPHRQPPPHFKPNVFNNSPPADPRAFLRTPSPTADIHSRLSEPSGPQFRSARTQPPTSPRGPPGVLPPRSQSPLVRSPDDHSMPPPPLRNLHRSPPSSLRNLSMSSNSGPGPAFASSPSSTVRSTGTRTPPPLQTPPLSGLAPASQPTSPTELPLSELEIIALWSHASLLYHHSRVSDALDHLGKIHERPGASPITLARLHINVGIMTESLAKGRVHSRTPPHKSAQTMIEAFQAAIKHSPDGPEGALATFFLGCALFDSQDFEKAASCFDMCEAVFAGESDVLNYHEANNASEGRPSQLQGGEKIELAPLGVDWVLYLSAVRENYHVAQERARIPAALGTMRGLHRFPLGIVIEEPLPTTPAPLSPLDESDEEAETVRSTLGLRPEDSELVPMRLDLGGAPPMPVRRRTTKKQDREEMERRREARRTRILIKLGDLRLNKPLPPLPHELTEAQKAERAERRAEAQRRQQGSQSPDVPPLPVAHVMGGMAFV